MGLQDFANPNQNFIVLPSKVLKVRVIHVCVPMWSVFVPTLIITSYFIFIQNLVIDQNIGL
jgi:uncharacterized membrane protein (DUF106 family)